MRRVDGLSRRLFSQGLVFVMALTGFGRSGNARDDAPIEVAPAEVAIEKFAFEPASLVIRRGGRVRWTNRDAAPHTATSVDGAWDSGGLEKQDMFSVSFREVGVFPYYCVYHPHMTGQITVVDE